MSIGKITVHKEVAIQNQLHTFALQTFSEEDTPKLKQYWDAWLAIRDVCEQAGNRAPNLAEYFTEGIVALVTNTARRVSKDYARSNDPSVRFTQKGKKSGDNLRLSPLQAIEVKSSTIQEDCTQISPSDHHIDLYHFIHFYNNGNLDGTFDIYEFSPDLIKSIIVCKDKGETLQDQLGQGRRAKLPIIKEVIIPNGITPIHKKLKLW